ncbi:GTP-binding protein ypt7 [Lamellibrachia satsuma]|nr:GTP-binding protein ypt7 [Lamellibrachia satsuma]
MLQRVPAFKIVLIGEPEVGKSSIFLKYIKNQFDYEYKPTRKVSIQNVVKKVNIPGDTVVGVTLWDLPSQDDMDLRETYYRNADAAIVVVDMNNTKSIELANTWKQEFANKVTKTKTLIETLPDGTHTSKMELLPCDSTLIPVLLLGNKYDLIEEKLQTEELKDMLNEPLGDDESESESNLLKSPQKEKPQCVKLLEEEAEEHHFVGSIMVSAKDENFSVHSAIQAFVRFLLEDSLPRGKKKMLTIEDEDKEETELTVAPQQRLLPQTGVIELDKIFQACSVPIKRSQDYATYYDLVLKTFKQRCADMGYLRESKASLEDCIIGLRDGLKSETELELKVKDNDGFVCLYHGKEEDEDYRMDKQLTKTLNIFNNEVSSTI